MFSTFTLPGDDTLIIRSQDIRRLETSSGNGTTLCWEEGGVILERWVEGSPAENLQRLAKEELEAYTQAQAQQQRAAQGYPVPPVMRGRR
jgi:hypothetical protein